MIIIFSSSLVLQKRRVGGELRWAQGDLQRGSGGRGPGHAPRPGVLLPERWTSLRQTAAEGETDQIRSTGSRAARIREKRESPPQLVQIRQSFL